MGVILLGYRGSGKTSVGRRLAAALATEFVDIDEAIVRAAGKSIRDIFMEEGESGFRDRETLAINDALRRGAGVISPRVISPRIISLGGGAVLREENRRLIIGSDYRRIYLRCDPQTLFQRIHADPATAASRPALTTLGGGIEEIRTLLDSRELLYREVATDEIDVTDLSVEEVVLRIERMGTGDE
ncbi:MAG: shikimate kinase [Burkholderiales bacterium]|nr:shikimate kinase [Phycisphaerae bacterium]